MKDQYNFSKIEKKWQDRWEKSNDLRATDPPASRSKKQKYYILVEFPYPSGDGLHVGHARSYIALDILARKKRKEGLNVLFPMGWDAFGLPTENYAIKTGIHPTIATKKNTEIFKAQQKSLGLSFDWKREIDTTDPSYYKWTQWIFIQLFNNGLAYKKKMPINWCNSCKIGLANEEVIDDKCERCGSKVVAKIKEQWMLKITKYADRLLNDLENVDYPERVKIGQRDWIGKSTGTEIRFKVHDTKLEIAVFTTKPETIFGCTYIVLSPGHPLASEINSKSKAINPVNNEKIPIFIDEYVLIGYGTGAIMGVPAHDDRDREFAKKNNLPIIEVINKRNFLIKSGKFTGMKSEKAKEKIVEWLIGKGKAGKKINYKLRDWIFSRQRYWGEPIPMIYCLKCARLPARQGWQPVEEKDLPIELPKIKNYKPTKDGESPLAKIASWIKVACPKCGGAARRETDVMPNWAGSNWYYLRYCDPNNKTKLASSSKLKYWMPVDWYNGGMEHTTLHLLYSRFIFKFLYDIGVVPSSVGDEPYKKRTSHGMILGEGGVKMSKSKGNVINPEEIIKEYGADTLRIYEMFMGPFEQTISWDTKGLKGASRFLEKVWHLQYKVSDKISDGHELEKLVHQTIKKVTDDIDNLKFNTAIAALMILVNKMEKKKEVSMNYYSILLMLLSPFAPHITNELWSRFGDKALPWKEEWPKYNMKATADSKFNLIIQINGKIRDKVEIRVGTVQGKAINVALEQKKIKKIVQDKKVKKTIFIKNKLINFVI